MNKIKELASNFGPSSVIFIGSGVSLEAGLPNWYTLIDWLKDYTLNLGACTKLADEFIEQNDLIEATTALRDELEPLGKTLTDFFIEYDACKIFKEGEPGSFFK
ncbi:hypothetical protein [Aliamphritea spongicola]|nr:hypothetical protein [Aliamphritea spongicola]